MAQQIKPDVPTLIRRISEEASLPEPEKTIIHKFNRHQLLELYVYISELKKSNKELILKINEMNQ
jgi:hypothetical protein